MGLGDGHDLKSSRFAGDLELEACYDNEMVLRKGDNGPCVERIQQALLDLGFLLPSFGADGSFGNETEAAIIEYQNAYGLEPDGVIGPATIASLDEQFASTFASTFVYHVPGEIPEIGQPSDNTCWAAAATMLFSWVKQESYTIEDVMKEAGTIFPAALKGENGEGHTLLPAEMGLLIDSLGFVQEPHASYTVEGLLSLLQRYGPLWMTIHAGGDYLHGNIITGIGGDYSPDGTDVFLIDPSDGKSDVIPLRMFMEWVEAASNLESIQLVHAIPELNPFDGCVSQ